MISRIMEIRYPDATRTMVCEQFCSMAELIACIGGRKSRGPAPDGWDRSDAMAQALDGLRWHGGLTKGGEWSTEEELMALAAGGYTAPVQNMKLRLDGLKQETARKGCIPAPAGFAPLIDRALDGRPDCMLAMRPRQRMAPVIHLCVSMDAVCNDSEKDLHEAGLAMVSAISRIEAQGVRVRLDCLSGFFEPCRADARDALMAVRVKEPDKALCLQRIAFAACHPSFERVLSFMWARTCPETTPTAGLGTELRYAMKHFGNVSPSDVAEAAFGWRDAVAVGLSELFGAAPEKAGDLIVSRWEERRKAGRPRLAARRIS